MSQTVDRGRQLVEMLRAGTVRVESVEGRSLGTAFRISDRLFLTAAHVVRGNHGGYVLVDRHGDRCEAVRLAGCEPRSAPIARGGAISGLPDIAVLRAELTPAESWSIVGLCTGATEGPYIAVGFLEGMTGDHAQDQIRLEFDGERTESSTRILKLTGATVQPGMSGGPVLDLDRYEVVGFLKADNGDGGAFVVCCEALEAAFPEHWASALTSASPDSAWRRARDAALGAVETSAALRLLMESTAGGLTKASKLLPGEVSRDDIRQPVRIRHRASTEVDSVSPTTVAGSASPSEASGSLIWDPLRSPWPRVGVVAAPGMGKSWMLAFHASALASNSLTVLTADATAAVRVRVPLLLDAADAARDLPDDPTPTDTVEMLGRAVHRQVGPSCTPDECRKLVSDVLSRRSLVLCVDGLDEVPGDIRQRLTSALAQVGPDVNQLVVSTRESARQTLVEVFPNGFAEFAIEGFTVGDARRFVSAWHHQDELAASSVWAVLRQYPDLIGLARVPLLLGFICRLSPAALGDSADHLPRTKAALYRDVTLGLLSARWREEAVRRPSDDSTSDPHIRLSLLAQAVGGLAGDWRNRPEEFLVADLLIALRSSDLYGEVERLARSRWATVQAVHGSPQSSPPDDFVLWEFVYDGILLRRTTEGGRPSVRFLHMVFAELCLAMFLVETTNRGLARETIERHRLFDRDWQDVFPIACGLATDPRELFSRLGHTLPDPWLTQATLEVRCLAEIGPGRPVDDQQVSRLISTLTSAALSNLSVESRRAIASICDLVERGFDSAIAAAHSLLQSEVEPCVRDSPNELLCALVRAGDARAIEQAIDTIDDSDVPVDWRLRRVDALCLSKSRSAVNTIVDRIGVSDSVARLNLASSLARGDVVAADAALALARSADVPIEVRTDLVLALVEHGGAEDIALSIGSDAQVSIDLRARTISSLLLNGLSVELELANALVSDVNLSWEPRAELARALIVRGDVSVLSLASELVTRLEVDFRVRYSLARAMASVAELGLRVLSAAACDHQRPAAERLQALRASVERSDAAAIHEAVAIVASNDQPVWLRNELAVALLSLSHSGLSVATVEQLLRVFAQETQSDGRRSTLLALALGARSADLRRFAQDSVLSLLDPALGSTAVPKWATGIRPSELIRALVATGTAAVPTLTNVALDARLELEHRMTAALGVASLQPRLAEGLSRLLDDQTVPEATRARLAVALGMSGCRSAFRRLAEMMTYSEAAYVAMNMLLESPSADQFMVREAVALAATAREDLLRAPTPVWSLDYGELIETLPLEGRSAAETQRRTTWAKDRLRRQIDAHILNLLLPQERAELARVGGMVECRATRVWLARWIPEYPDIATVEVERLRTSIVNDPSQLPAIGEGATVFAVFAELSALLDEWTQLGAREQWQQFVNLLANYEAVLKGADARQLLQLADERVPGWPGLAGYSYVLALVAEESLADAVRQLSDVSALLNAQRKNLNDGRTADALDGAAMGVLRWPEEAAIWFYASVAAAGLGGDAMALALMERSASHATLAQAVEGWKSVSTYRSSLQFSEALASALQARLAARPGFSTAVNSIAPGTDGVAAGMEDATPTQPTATAAGDERATESEHDGRDDDGPRAMPT